MALIQRKRIAKSPKRAAASAKTTRKLSTKLTARKKTAVKSAVKKASPARAALKAKPTKAGRAAKSLAASSIKRSRPSPLKRRRLSLARGFIRLGTNLKFMSFLAAFAVIGTVGLLLTHAETTTITINDSTKGTGLHQFNFSGNWRSHPTQGAHQNDEHFSNTAGSSYTVQFSGTQVKVYSMKNPNYGYAEYSVDGGTPVKVDHYAPSREFGFLAYTSPKLTDGIHTLTVVVKGEKSTAATDRYVVADRVDVIKETNPPATSTVNVNDNAKGTGLNQFEFVGTWGQARTDGAYQNDEHYSNSRDSYYQVRFSGTQIKVHSMKHPFYGKAEYTIDGQHLQIVDHYAPSRQFGFVAYTSPVLSNGPHTLKVRILGEKQAAAQHAYVAADRVEVLSTSSTTQPAPAPTPAKTVSVNDATIGTGNNQFNYSGSWRSTTTTGAYNNDEHFSNSANSTYTVTFSGTQIKAYSMKHPFYGIAAYSIDGGPETMVDHYASSRQFNFLAYTSPVLTEGQHTLKVRVTGNKNAAANERYIVADRVDITSGAVTSNPTPAPNPTPTQPAPAPSPAPSTGKKLIMHQQHPPDVKDLASKPAAFDALPFDGTSFVHPFSTTTQRTTPIDLNAVRATFSPLGRINFSRSKYNMPIIYATPGASFNNYTTVSQNFGKIALAAKEANLYGIKFDVEEYFGTTVWRGPACGGLAEPQCRTAAHNAGKQVMTEIIRNWPNAKVLTSFGPWISAKEYYAYMNQNVSRANDIAWANPYQGNFMAGMIEASIGTQAQLIDGGEIYNLYEVHQFTNIKGWMKNSFPNLTYLVPSSLKPHWAGKYNMGFGVYDWPAGFASQEGEPAGTPDRIQKYLTNALKGTDEVVWYYPEMHNYTTANSRSGKPMAPADWMRAVTNAYNSK